MSQRIDLTVCMVLLFTPALAIAGSIGTYSGCKPLGASARAACERCVGSGSFYQPASGSCGMTADMHVSKAIVSEKPPPRPKAMPQTGKDYVTITGATFDIGARATDENKDEKELFDARVTLTHSFAMKTTEVTQGEWLYILGNVSPSFDTLQSCVPEGR